MLVLTLSVSNQLKNAELIPDSEVDVVEASTILTQLKQQRDDLFEGEFLEETELKIVQKDTNQARDSYRISSNDTAKMNPTTVLNWVTTPTHLIHHIAIILVYSGTIYLAAMVVSTVVKNGLLNSILGSVKASPILIILVVGVV